MCRQNSAAFQFILFVYFVTYQLNFRRSSQSSFIFFNIYFLLKIYWEVSYSLDGKELAWSMQSSSLKTTLTVAWNTLVVTHYTCMRNVFGMNRKILSVRTAEGTNPCRFARPPCPLPANRYMGIARTHCHGDRWPLPSPGTNQRSPRQPPCYHVQCCIR